MEDMAIRVAAKWQRKNGFIGETLKNFVRWIRDARAPRSWVVYPYKDGAGPAEDPVRLTVWGKGVYSLKEHFSSRLIIGKTKDTGKLVSMFKTYMELDWEPA